MQTDKKHKLTNPLFLKTRRLNWEGKSISALKESKGALSFLLLLGFKKEGNLLFLPQEVSSESIQLAHFLLPKIAEVRKEEKSKAKTIDEKKFEEEKKKKKEMEESFRDQRKNAEERVVASSKDALKDKKSGGVTRYGDIGVDLSKGGR